MAKVMSGLLRLLSVTSTADLSQHAHQMLLQNGSSTKKHSLFNSQGQTSKPLLLTADSLVVD